jgi:hypothetical protein
MLFGVMRYAVYNVDMTPLSVVLAILFVLVIAVCLVLLIPKTRNGIHGYIYGRWTSQYVAFIRNKWGPQTNGLGRRWLAERYHGDNAGAGGRHRYT